MAGARGHSKLRVSLIAYKKVSEWVSELLGVDHILLTAGVRKMGSRYQ